MSWRDQLQPASFRGVPFHTEGADASIGRRTETHEYPGRDVPWIEDLGRRARTLSLDGYVLGADYMAARDRLIAALEAAGPATLVHPYWGALTVVCTDCRVSESSREGGMARFSMAFAEAGAQQFPAARTDSAQTVAARADQTRDASRAAFVVEYGVEALPGWVAESAESTLGAALREIDDLAAQLTPDLSLLAELQLEAARVAGTLAALVRAPVILAAQVQARVEALARIPQRPADALAALAALFSAAPPTVAAATTRANQQAALNTAATAALVRQLALAEAARLIPDAAFDSVSEAAAARDAVLAAIDAEQAITPDDTLFGALTALAAATTRAVAARADSLARLGTVRFNGPLPALVVAQRVYGDARRADEIVARNRVRHPGFVPGGVALEVTT